MDGVTASCVDSLRLVAVVAEECALVRLQLALAGDGLAGVAHLVAVVGLLQAVDVCDAA